MIIVEQIYFWIMFAVMIVFAVGFNMILDNERGFFTTGDYGDKVKAIVIFKWGLSIVFILVNLISMFFQFEYVLSAAITLAFNLFSFGFLLYDTLFKQVSTEEYIVTLQNELLQDVPLTDIFEYGENIAKYDLTGNDSTMLFKVIQGEKGFLLGKQGKEKNELLIPKERMDESEIKFLCEQINIYWTQESKLPEYIRVFANKDLYNHRKQFVWIPTPKIKFLYSTNFKKRFVKTITIMFYILLFLFAIFAALDHFEILTFETISQWIKHK